MSSGELFIDGKWAPAGGSSFSSLDPATGETVWQGAAAAPDDVAAAVGAAERAGNGWSTCSLEERAAVVTAFGEQLDTHREELAGLIGREVGKPPWESNAEVSSMIAKIDISRRAHLERCSPIESSSDGVSQSAHFHPHGVMAVFGPFNFPGHLPNGHIVPALLAGNTVVLKPSEQAPAVAECMVAAWQAAGLPAGVVNLVQGGHDTGLALAGDDRLDGLLFTGSYRAGATLAEKLARRTGVIVALEMGGNNPLVVHDVADVDAAVLVTIQSAYATAGQRCTCARRLIVARGEAGDAFIDRLVARIGRVRVGCRTDVPEPFMGPVISAKAARAVLDGQAALLEGGGRGLVECEAVGDVAALLRPGLIDVTEVAERADEEIFGPLLQIIRTDDFAAAVEEARRTRFGLAAALLSDRREHYEHFRSRVRAGCVNWNRPTTGASSALPFGGLGHSGNHRPSAYFATDYCAYPVASIEADALVAPTGVVGLDG